MEFRPPELSDNEFLLCKPPGLWRFVTTAQQANTEGERRPRLMGGVPSASRLGHCGGYVCRPPAAPRGLAGGRGEAVPPSHPREDVLLHYPALKLCASLRVLSPGSESPGGLVHTDCWSHRPTTVRPSRWGPDALPFCQVLSGAHGERPGGPGVRVTGARLAWRPGSGVERAELGDKRCSRGPRPRGACATGPGQGTPF